MSTCNCHGGPNCCHHRKSNNYEKGMEIMMDNARKLAQQDSIHDEDIIKAPYLDIKNQIEILTRLQNEVESLIYFNTRALNREIDELKACIAKLQLEKANK